MLISIHKLYRKLLKGYFSKLIRRILLIDDDNGFIKILKSKLSPEGFEILTASTGEEGLQIAKTTKPDLILLDVILPGIKGRGVCTQLKQDNETKNIPVVFLTSKDSPDDVKAELDAGAILHLTKPISIKQLLSEIRRIESL